MAAKQIIKTAQRYGACDLLRGNESPEQLMQLLTTAQGLEFYQNTGFPTLDVFDSFKGEQAESYGIYINAGKITLHNPLRVILIGDTQATITVADLADEKHNIVAMAGASADVTAWSWAVVFTQEIGGVIITEVKDNAIVRCIK